MGASFRTNTWMFTAATLTALVVPCLFMLSSFTSYRQAAAKAVRAEALGGEIRYLDEVLTMSARLGALSGDNQWRTRYDSHVEHLDAAIKGMSALDTNNHFLPLLAKTDAANQALIVMETEAFALSEGGRRAQGYAKLLSPAYAEQKAIYAAGLEQASAAVRSGFAKEAGQHWARLAIASLAATIGGMACFFAWFALATRVLRRQDALHTLVRQERDAAQAANQAKSQFLANMSHELRTPLNAIIGYSEILMENAQDNERPGELLDLNRVHGAGQRLLALINDLLDLSRAEAGKLELHIQAVNVSTLLADAVATVEPIAAKQGNALHTQFADDLGVIHTDGLRLSQCLLNLLSNATKFTRAGIITLSAHRECIKERDWLVLSVTDTGCGMSPKQLEQIFEPFTQVDSDLTRLHQGAGLGLAITRQLAGLLGGDISACSAPGSGSCFRLSVPAARAASEGQSPPAPPLAQQAA